MTHAKQIEYRTNPYMPAETVSPKNMGDSTDLNRTHSRIVVMTGCVVSWIVPVLGMPIGAYMCLIPKGGGGEFIGTVGIICFSLSLFIPTCIGYWFYRKLGLKGLLMTGVWIPGIYIGFLLFVGLAE